MIISIENSSDETDCSAVGHHAVLGEKSKNQCVSLRTSRHIEILDG